VTPQSDVARLDRPELARLWDRIADRLQRNGLAPQGVVQVGGLDRGERHALAGLLGRAVVRERARVDLAVLDQRLRAAGGRGLVAIVDGLRGPLVNRPGLRQAAAEQRSAMWASGRDELERCGLAGAAWVEPWLEDLRRSGAVARLGADRGREALVRAVKCLGLVSLTGFPTTDSQRDLIGRSELAWRVTGTTHGLDDDTALAAIVLRGVACAVGEPPASSAAERRDLWRAAGVLTDEVSTTLLVLGLRPPGNDLAAVNLRDRADRGLETHLTLRDLHRLKDVVPSGTSVFICENPRVLEAAMDAGARQAVVCTQGNPTVVALKWVERLAASGADLRYRGDFDWPGVAIANRMVTDFGCEPWRMGTADYEDAIARAGARISELPELGGRPVDARWDPMLSPVMAKVGRAVHEESMLDSLVADLM
jgi:uncharacterized protein (TIGR02679 family)